MASPGGSNSSEPSNSKNKKRPISSSSGGHDNSSGTSSGLAGSEESPDLRALMEQRRKRRKESNRESARRSRMRKQLHLDGMAAQVASLRAENYKMLAMLERATVGFLAVDSENAVLRTQAMELESRLRSLNEIVKCMIGFGVNLDAAGTQFGMGQMGMGMGIMPPMMPSMDLYQCI